MKKNLFFIGATLFIGATAFSQSKGFAAEGFYSLATVLAAAPTITKQKLTTDEDAIRSIFTTLETGWNNKSGETFSSVFADVHDYIVVNGLYFSNFTKKGNAAAHQALFNGVYKTSDIKLKVDKITFLRPDLAQVTSIGARYEKASGVPQDPNGIMTVIAEKKDGVWKIISFHNHDLNIDELKQRSPMPVNVMYAAWYKN